MAFKFFNIGKANDEIVRLESEVTRLNSELVAAKENAAQVESAAEQTKTDLAAAQSKVTELEKTISQNASDLSAANLKATEAAKERDDLKAIIEKPDGEIEKRAAIKAQEIVASQGGAIIPIKPQTSPGGTSTANTWAEKAIQAAKEKSLKR